MKKRITALVCAAVLVLGAAVAMTGCSGKQVAATVNGVEIYEETITKDVEAFRSSYGLEDADSWAEWMSTYGYTPETVRETMIDSYVQTEVIKAAAKENGITIESSKIDEYVDQVKANYDSDDAFNSALESAGYTLETYRERIEEALLEQELMDKVTPLTTPDDETLLSYAKMYSSYLSGAKRSSHILISDEATAQEVLTKVKNGEISFEDAAKQYSEDTGSASNGGDVGWDKVNSFVTEYTEGLDALEEGQISDLVKSDYGYHIIKCTEVYTAPDEVTSTDQIPSGLLDYISETAQSYEQQTNFSNYVSEYKENANVVINDMPKNLSYDVDMSAYTSNTSNTSNTTNTTNTTENTTDTSNTTNTSNTSNTTNSSN